jgi:hypothetical protein
MSALLAAAIAAFWPRRADQERWLDLGEHKPWTPQDLARACDLCVAWLQRQGLCPMTLPEPPGDGAAACPKPKELRDQALWLADDHDDKGSARAGVAEANLRLAPLLGSDPGTYANSLSGACKPWRLDHLWARLLAEPDLVAREQALYHARTRAGLARGWVRLSASLRHGPSLQERLVLASLLALYQRRKPTQDVRANRGQQQPRRLTPKPAAGGPVVLVQPGQALLLLARCAALRDDPRAQAIAAVVMEAVLTGAHLDAHRARSTEAPDPSFPRWVDECLALASPLLGAEAEVWRFRVARMRAYQAQDSRSPPMPDNPHPYVEASVHLALIYAHRRQPGQELRDRLARLRDMSAQDLPGLAMLHPQIQSWSERFCQ